MKMGIALNLISKHSSQFLTISFRRIAFINKFRINFVLSVMDFSSEIQLYEQNDPFCT